MMKTARFCMRMYMYMLAVPVQSFLLRNQFRTIPRGYSYAMSQVSSQTSRLNGQSEPELIVLDLDNTVWTPELYQLRKLQRANKTPVAARDVKLMDGAKELFAQKRTGKITAQLAVASRTKSVDWAHDLLTQFKLRDIISYIEIFPGNKEQHFENLRAATGLPYSSMLFFDDARGGKYGNCVPVSNLGVLAVHCPNGLYNKEVLDTGLKSYSEWDKKPGTIIEWDGAVSTEEERNTPTPDGTRQQGSIKFVNQQKRFGFIMIDGNRSGKDLFFHFSGLPDDAQQVAEGDKLSFVVANDPTNGKTMASQIEMLASDSSSDNTVPIPSFSMNMPFAALLANEYKTLETRNGTMFTTYPEGSYMLLHVGQRTYPDGDRHIDVMKTGGLNDDEIEQLKTLPKGFGRGMAIAVLEIGRTYEASVRERSDEEMQRNICALGSDSGKMVTEIRRVAYLKKPVKVPAQGGVFKLRIDPDVLPDGWTLPEQSNAQPRSKPSGTVESGKPMYTITG